ncbi:hypothetical protein P4233_25190 [Pseudomonas aeruginosa]|nr:hypothetical protein [Pseudomonas aeruginosa]
MDTADVCRAEFPGTRAASRKPSSAKWLKRTGKRDRMVIASKVGMDMSSTKVSPPPISSRPWSARYDAYETDYLDLYQSHTESPPT